MKYSIIFLWRQTLILMTVVILTVFWFMSALSSTKSKLTNPIVAPPFEYDNGEAKPLKMTKPTFTKKKSRIYDYDSDYGNDLPDAPTRVDWLGRLVGKEGFVKVASGSYNAPGELGTPVVLPDNITEETKEAVSQGWIRNAFNQYVSDLISVRRKLVDPRDEWCKVPGRFLEDLPQTSVVICFHNEAWSTLLRTVHSVLDRSPEHLIKEIILVDDYSNMPHLLQQLDDYMSSLPKVRIVRATRREGLIRARLLGIRYVTAPVLTYLDSHCECTDGWLEPLLDRIARNKTTVVCPVIDVIDDDTFEYYHNLQSPSVNVGGFSWNLQFNWHTIPPKERARHQHSAEPVWSPTMAGGLFAIDKEFFERLGTYDSGFDIWGGENLELSFKTWMCGGTLEIVPCSHVGHIFRSRSPYKWGAGVNVLKKNSVRLAEVWLDDYAKYYYQRIYNYKGDYGNITDRRELRQRLGCKSFEWYLKNIYPEQFIPGESVAHGEFRIILNDISYCLDGATVSGHESSEVTVKIRRCHNTGGKQFWMYSKDGEIRRDETCVDYSNGEEVTLQSCHGGKGNQLWQYSNHTKLLMHGTSKKCMAISRNKDKIIMEKCNKSEERQMWNLENFNPERLTRHVV